MWNRQIRRTTIGLSILWLVAAAGLECFAQCGTNASPYDCCTCVPARPWGYYQTRWHRWPGVMYGGMPVAAPNGSEGISPSQIELPNPKNEAELKTPSQEIPAPAEAPAHTAPEEAPSNPFQTTPSNPSLEPAPEQGPEQSQPGDNEPSKTEPGTAEPGMEMPGTEPPNESPSGPPDTKEPGPNASPSLPSDSNETKPNEESMPEPDSGKSSDRGRGTYNQSPGLQLRRADTGKSGRQRPDYDPAPVMPTVCSTASKPASPAPRAKVKSSNLAQTQSANAAPERIAPPLNAQRLEASKAEPRNGGLPGANPLRADEVRPATWVTEEQNQDAVRTGSGDAVTVFRSTNPLRPN